MTALRIPALLLSLTMTGCGESTSGPRVETPDPPDPPAGNFTFTYAPPAGAPAVTAVAVRGTFNGWDAAVMQRQPDGTWSRAVDIPEGNTEYKFFINGTWVADMCYDEGWGDPARGYVVDPDAAGCVPDGYQGQNAVVSRGAVPLDLRHDATDPSDVSVAGGRLSVRFRARTGEVTGARLVTGSDTLPMHPQFTTGLTEVWRVAVDAPVGEYRFLLDTTDGTADFGPYAPPSAPFEAVEWVADAVGYQIFPERFWNGDPSNDSLALSTDEYAFRDPALGGTPPVLTSEWNGPVGESHCCHQYFGGDLQGILDRLDHLSGLGVTALYLNPIFSAGSAHGYDTFDYLDVAPNLGDSAVLRTLLDQAHARGMRVIWDFVPNHVGIGHPAFQDAVNNGEASDYWDWFRFHVPADSVQVGNGEHYDAWWGYGSLPELQTSNPEVMAHLLEVATGWTDFGFDGIRVDVPNELDNRAVFFPAWREAVKAVDSDVYLVGEIWERDPSWLRGNQFDALMNYALGQGVVEPFARGEMAGPVAAREVAAQYAAYPEASVAMGFNLVASHDTDRLLTKMGGGELGDVAGSEARARHRLAAAVLYALPGMSMTFQGDECAFLGGAQGRHTARYPMQWEACDGEFVAHYAELARLKRETPALGSPAYRAYPDAGALLAFYRGEPGDGEVLAVFNNASGAAALALPAGTWEDASTGESFTGTAAVQAFGWRYLRRQ